MSRRDPKPQRATVERATTALPGWVLLLAALALFALAVLTPAWLEYEQLQWQRAVLQAQSAHLQRQADRYAQLHTALVEADPVLLERLAFVELGLKPVGKTPLLPATPQSDTGHHFASNGHSPRLMSLQSTEPAERESIETVNRWPIEPLPRVGRELPDWAPPNTRLTRLTTGHSRLGLLAAGLLCLLAACYPRESGGVDF